MILAHFCVARIRDFGQGSDDCAYIIPHPFAKINTILSKFVQVCPTCAQKHCTRKQISIASGSYPFCAAFFFMLLLAIQLDTDFMIFKAAQLRKSVIRLIFKFNRPFTSTLYPIKRTMSTEFGIMSLQSSTLLFSLTKAANRLFEQLSIRVNDIIQFIHEHTGNDALIPQIPRHHCRTEPRILFPDENAPRCAVDFCILANANETQRSSATLSGMSGRQNQKNTSRWRR